ncbi:hypothetical protein QBC47DRAFT_398245 [Echria macrotheca]|uniref:Uncharacterized protein n=1 Tax=Echria macrotheca TaxID=438768 RepID=A0AAJ0BLL2_9PEZI|nr:hypothetical protein QBC47DRAFT_398245 [Echria macrotheca]
MDSPSLVDSPRHWVDVPEPLQIIKRPDSRRSQRTLCRRTSTDSSYSDSSSARSLGSLGDPTPLTVPKRRGNNSTPCGRGPIPRPRRSTSYTAPDAVRDRTHVPQLSNKASLLFLGQRQAGRQVKHGNTGRPVPSPAPSASRRRFNPSPTRLPNSQSMHHLPATPSSLDGPPNSPFTLTNLGPTASALDTRQPRPIVLVPQIAITPESRVLDGSRSNTLWVAIQLSTQLCPASRRDADEYYGGRRSGFRGFGCSQTGVFRYGCLYDVMIEVLPTQNSEILQVLDDEAACTKPDSGFLFMPGLHTNTRKEPGILYLESRLLVMAQVRLKAASAAASHAVGHVRQSSDDLIQDLEYHLGTTDTEYLEVRVTYRHSGFPHQGPLSDPTLEGSATCRKPADGIIKMQTRIETSARAVIQRHNSSSPWSPRPVLLPPSPPLFEIIASHWGSAHACEFMNRVESRARSPYALWKPASLSPSAALCGPFAPPGSPGRAGNGTLRPQPPALSPTRAAPPPIPRRKASLNRSLNNSLEPAPDQASSPSDLDDYDMKTDPARRIWSEMRRTSEDGGDNGTPTYRVNKVREVPSSSSACLVPETGPGPSSVAGDGDVAVAARRRRPLAAIGSSSSTRSNDTGIMGPVSEKAANQIESGRDRGDRYRGGILARRSRGGSGSPLVSIKDDEGEGGKGGAGVTGSRLTNAESGKDEKGNAKWGGWSWWQQ